MSDIFPYNHSHGKPSDCEPYKDYQGAPITFPAALGIIEKWYWWHNQEADTDTWTQSNDGADHDQHLMALGLLAFSCDPTYMHLLAALGSEVERRAQTLWNLLTRESSPYPASDPAIAALVQAKVGKFGTYAAKGDAHEHIE